MEPYLQTAATQFLPPEQLCSLEPYGQGNVHQTYLLRARPPAADLLLQRLNETVFRRPEQVLANLKLVGEHLARRLAQVAPARRWEIIRLQPTREGGDWWRDPAGRYWRALNFIGRTRTLDVVASLQQAREVGWALGFFHRLLADLPTLSLADPLPGFHVTPLYLQEYDRVAAGAARFESDELRWAREFVSCGRGRAGLLEEAKAAGRLRLVPIHGDPKVNNILWAEDQDLAVAIVDWDTVKPGLILHDLGDCLRSAANPWGEETQAWEEVRFDLGRCQALLAGYQEGAGGLEPTAKALLPEAVWLIAFELGLRFLIDYLVGNHYFRVQEPEQNLRRALVQFRLAASIENQLPELRELVRGLPAGGG